MSHAPLRHKGHLAFDRLWKSKLMGRAAAYSLLAKWLNIPISQCHFSTFTADQIRAAIEFCRSINVKWIKNPRTEKRRDNGEQRRRRIEELTLSEIEGES